MLYRVTIGEDVYLGEADEVVHFMRRADGAPGHDAASFMEGVAKRIEVALGITDIDTTDAVAFLESLREHGVLAIEAIEEPSDRRTDPEEALGDGPVAYGPGVDPDDLDP